MNRNAETDWTLKKRKKEREGEKKNKSSPIFQPTRPQEIRPPVNQSPNWKTHPNSDFTPYVGNGTKQVDCESQCKPRSVMDALNETSIILHGRESQPRPYTETRTTMPAPCDLWPALQMALWRWWLYHNTHTANEGRRGQQKGDKERPKEKGEQESNNKTRLAWEKIVAGNTLVMW